MMQCGVTGQNKMRGKLYNEANKQTYFPFPVSSIKMPHTDNKALVICVDGCFLGERGGVGGGEAWYTIYLVIK